MAAPAPRAALPTSSLWLLIACATVARLLFAQTGFGIDEAYTVATARDFHLSGYDHPPLAWWLAGAMQQLFETTIPWVIRLPFIALLAIATWQIHRLTTLLFNAQAGILAAFIFCLAPALGFTDGSWVLPDGPLLVGLLGGAIFLVHALIGPSPKPWHWLAAGAFGGVAMLAKYHGVFFFFGAVLFVLTQRRHWPVLRTPWPYLGAGIGLLVFSPVIVWNITHEFASFAFQGGRTGDTVFHPLNPLLVLLGQAAFLTPWIWLGLLVATRAALRGPRHEGSLLLCCLGLPLIVLFTLVSAVSSGQILFHWAIPGYLFLIPLLGNWLVSRPRLARRWVHVSMGLNGTAIAALLALWFAPLAIQKLGVPADPLAQMRPLTAIHAYLDARPQLEETPLVVAPLKWHSAGQFDVALNGRLPVTCFCRDARQYSILAPLSDMAGKNFLIPVPLKRAQDAPARYGAFFTHFTRLDDLAIAQGGTTRETYAMFLGTALKPGSQPE